MKYFLLNKGVDIPSDLIFNESVRVRDNIFITTPDYIAISDELGVEKTKGEFDVFKEQIPQFEIAKPLPTLEEKVDLMGQMLVELYLKDGVV